MKMAKPSPRDVKAAEELMQILQLVDARFCGPDTIHGTGDNLSELLRDGEEMFDCDDATHLRTLYNNLARLLKTAPGFYSRVISGMCHVVLFEKNEILDPDSDCIDLHPRFARLTQDANRYNWLRTRDLDAISAGGVFAGMTPENVVLNGEDLDAAIDAAIAFQADFGGSPA